MVIQPFRTYQYFPSSIKWYNSINFKITVNLVPGEKPYQCTMCGTCFRRSADLKYHTTSVHSTLKAHQCEYCGKEFSRKYSLTRMQAIFRTLIRLSWVVLFCCRWNNLAYTSEGYEIDAPIQFIGEFTPESETTNATSVRWHSELQLIFSSTRESTRVNAK